MKNKPIKSEFKMNLKTMTILSSVILTIIAAFNVPLPAAQTQPHLEPDTHKGRVISTMDSGGYTYIEFEEKGKKLWVACPLTAVYVGDMIEFSRAAVMKNFHSNTLNRTFESILFAGSIKIGDKDSLSADESALAHAPHGHSPGGPKPRKKITVAPGSVKKLEGGYTVAECFAMKKELKGKELAVRGIVVKFSSRIMGKNWIHIKDGTGKKGSNDLTVTTEENARVGDLIIVKGIMACDKNFGAGYFYPVIIEDVSIIVE